MTQYISKSAVVAEIERRLKEYRTFPDYQTDSNYMELCNILSFLDILEVKEMDEEYNGKAMLYVLEKGVKQGRRELIDKACKWWEDDFTYPSMTSDEIEYYKSKIEDFRRAMEA